MYHTSNYTSIYLLPLHLTPTYYLLSIKQHVQRITCNNIKIRTGLPQHIGWLDKTPLSEQQKACASCFQLLISTQLANTAKTTQLRATSAQKYLNQLWSNRHSCRSRTAQTGCFARVHRQHWEAAGTCLWKAGGFAAVRLWVISTNILANILARSRPKVYEHYYLQKDIIFLCWSLVYPVHMLKFLSTTLFQLLSFKLLHHCY